MSGNRSTARISSWARNAMSEDAWKLADRLRLIVVGGSPKGPWTVRHPRLIEALNGGDVDALILRASKEITK